MPAKIQLNPVKWCCSDEKQQKTNRKNSKSKFSLNLTVKSVYFFKLSCKILIAGPFYALLAKTMKNLKKKMKKILTEILYNKLKK